MKFNGESDGPLFPVVQPKPKKRHFLDHMVPNFLYSNSYQFFNIIVIIMIINIIITLIIIIIIIIIIFFYCPRQLCLDCSCDEQQNTISNILI